MATRPEILLPQPTPADLIDRIAGLAESIGRIDGMHRGAPWPEQDLRTVATFRQSIAYARRKLLEGLTT